MRRVLAPLAVSGLLLSSALSAHAAVSSSTVPALSQAQVRLPSAILPGIAAIPPLGAAPVTQRLRIGVALQRPHPAAEQAFLSAVEDPASPQYHRYLTPAQVASRFGLSPAVTSLVTDQLAKAGLHVDSTDASGDYVSAYGSVAQVEKAFDVSIDSFSVKGVPFIANTTAPLVPKLADVLTVVGLNTLQHFSTPTRPSAKPAAAASRTAKPAQDTCAAGICTGLTTPQDLWSVYDQPTAYEGQGQTIAIIGEGSTKTTVDALPVFEKHYGLPKVPVIVHCVEKNSCGTDTGGSGEWQIDTQASTGMAPKIKNLQLYFSQHIFDTSLNLAFLAWIDDAKGPTIASASLGECEATPANGILTGPLAPTDGNLNGGPIALTATGNGEEEVLDPALVKAHLEGRTLFASSGDGGSSCPELILPVVGAANGLANQGLPQVEYPATSPDATAVGGTVLYTKDGSKPTARDLETAWTFGGGGTSLFETAPSWQSTVPAILGRCLSTSQGATTNTGKLCRGVPDVAAQSGDALTNGYALINADGTGGDGGGTSLASPLWAGMWTRVQAAALKNTGKTAGFAPPQLYKIGTGASYSKGFHDITTGTNGVYPTLKGWDYTTGFGVPRVSGLISILAPVKKITKPVTMSTPTKPTKPTTGGSASGQLPRTGLGTGLPLAALVLIGMGAYAVRRPRRTA